MKAAALSETLLAPSRLPASLPFCRRATAAAHLPDRRLITVAASGLKGAKRWSTATSCLSSATGWKPSPRLVPERRPMYGASAIWRDSLERLANVRENGGVAAAHPHEP